MPAVEHINPYGSPEEKKTGQVKRMFDSIAPAYDLMNTAMSLGLHRRWLGALVRRVTDLHPRSIVDLATGTGDVALALARAVPEAAITGVDLSEGMLTVARKKAAKAGADIRFICADALEMPLPDNSADVVTIAYGLRNFEDISGGLARMLRLLRPGGTLFVLELAEPVNPLMHAGYVLYTRTLVPTAGWIASGDRKAYAYLPRSIAACPAREQMKELMHRQGFTNCQYKAMAPGTCVLYSADKPL